MSSKRRKNAPPASNGRGLAAGEVLKRNTLAGDTISPWGWAGTEVRSSAGITLEHRLATCGLAKRNKRTLCPNKYAPTTAAEHIDEKPEPSSSTSLNDEVIEIDDEANATCSKRTCKNNPFCLNYLGQARWEDEDEAWDEFLELAHLGENPIVDSRDPELPVGLKNLGATCYANASLQVWYRDLSFRAGVYKCQPSHGISEEKFKDSPIFQLQVTFAAMQEGIQNVFNPTKLVESLQLRTAEQQDAQEFSKLFMSHLDAEFRKQDSPSVRSLVTDQFEGMQIYGTLCKHCNYRSERTSNFLEVEINFDKDANLEDCLGSLLQEELLSGDNKYSCSGCNSLQDAIRYSEFRSLPPVLHLSVMRFVFDFNTMERKKSKHSISFPQILDMSAYVGGADARKTATLGPTQCTGNDVYELRGILLHKGTSAYHGHYEAQIFDTTNQAWFQFNDEEVTKITELGDKDKASRKAKIKDEDENYADGKSERPRKRQKLDDDSVSLRPKPTPASGRISSKDAYMLVYTRKEPQADINDSTSSTYIPKPPSRALEAIAILSVEHNSKCEEYMKREMEAKSVFAERRQKVMNNYRQWPVSDPDTQDYSIVSQNSLKAWLEKHSMESAVNQLSFASPADRPSTYVDLLIQDILCPHGELDYKKSNQMKCISLDATRLIKDETSCVFAPERTKRNVCEACVEISFAERCYRIDHPRLVQEFNDACGDDHDNGGYWISKPWLKDWRTARPKMHTPDGDPGPNSPGFSEHVQCEHGMLSCQTTNRCLISVAAFSILHALYPDWTPFTVEAECCTTCQANQRISKVDQSAIRRRAEDEKVRLKMLYDFGLSDNFRLLEDVPCAVIPTTFIKSWRRWIVKPVDWSRPDSVDTGEFFCEHGHLVFDPNCTQDLDNSLTVIKRTDWDTLQCFYSTGPIIALEKRRQAIDGVYSYVTETPICLPCRMRRKTEWESTEISICLRAKDDPLNGESPASSATVPTNGSRQSTRLRQRKQYGEKRKVIVTKSTTVKDMKVMAQEQFKIPTICQQLFYKSQVLEDNTQTTAELDILANDTVDLKELNEVHDLEYAEDISTNGSRDEGQGFGGTVLGMTSSPPVGMESSPSPQETIGKICSACTFAENPLEAPCCAVCNTLFA